jgi:hypothetical protein
LRRKAEASAAVVKRKEEDRRNQEERRKAKILQRERQRHVEAEKQTRLEAEKQAEAKRKEDEGQRELLHEVHGVRAGTKKIDASNGRGPTRQARGRSKGSEFYLPQSQQVNIEETPAKPLTLLAAFTHADEYISPDDPPTFSSSQDKRVHWKDASNERHGTPEVDKQQTLNPNAMQERSLAIKPSGNSRSFAGKENEQPAPDQRPTALLGMLEHLALAPQGKNDAYQMSHDGVESKGVAVTNGDGVQGRQSSHFRKRSSQSPQRGHIPSKRDCNRARSPRGEKLSTAKDPPMDEEVASKVDSQRPSSLMTAFPHSQTILDGTVGESSSHGPPTKKRVYGSSNAGGRAGLNTSGNASVASWRSASSKSAPRSFTRLQTSEKSPNSAPPMNGHDATVGVGTKGSQGSRKHDVVPGRSSSQSASRYIIDYASTHKVDTLQDGQSGLVEGSKSTNNRTKGPVTVKHSSTASSRHQKQTDDGPDHSVQKDVLGNGDGRKSTHRSKDSIFSGRSTSIHASQSIKDEPKRRDMSPPLTKVQGELVDADRQKLSYKSNNDFATSRRPSSKADYQAVSEVTSTKKGYAVEKKAQGDEAQDSKEILKVKHKSGDTSNVSRRTSSNPDSRPSKGGSRHDHKPILSKLERDIGFSTGDAKIPHRKSGNASIASGRSHSSKTSSRQQKGSLGNDKAAAAATQPWNSDATSSEGRKSEKKSSNASIASARSTSSKLKGTSSTEAGAVKKSIHDDASTAVSKSSRVSGQSRKRSHSNETSGHPSKGRSRKKSAIGAVSKASSKSFTDDDKYDFHF